MVAFEVMISMDPHIESTEKKQGEVVVLVSGEEQSNSKDPKIESLEESSGHKTQSPSPEIVLKSPVRPPRLPRSETLIFRKSVCKPKSRFVEQNVPVVPVLNSAHDSSHTPYLGLPNPRASSTPNTPKDEEDEEEDEDEDEDDEIYRREQSSDSPVKRKRFRVRNSIECLILVLAIGCCFMSVLFLRLQVQVLLGLEIWRWCLMVAVVFCGRLVTSWFIQALVFMIERNFLLKKAILYYVDGLKKSVQFFLWLLLVLLSWSFVFNQVVPRSPRTENVFHFVTRLLISFLLGSVIWLLKTLLVKIMASSFHMNRFFDRIQESIFHQYILQTLSGPPVMELAGTIGAATTNLGQLSFTYKGKGKGKRGEKQEVIDVTKLHKMQQDKVSAWTMKGLVHVIRTSRLWTLTNTMDESFHEGERREITSEWEAKAVAYRIFKNVAKSGSKFIDAEDLLRFLSREEVEYVLPLFEGAGETGKIRKSALKNWVVKAYLDRKSLALTLNDTKTAVNQLHKLAATVVIFVNLIITLILTGIATTQILVFISSQVVVVVFMVGNACKMAFEAIIFVFVMHPFDVGDRCVVDGIEMVVEEMNILNTVFLKFDNEKIYYPNSVLATKPISNFYRSPEMGDGIEFSIDVSTSIETIGALKSKIKKYIEGKPTHWNPNHCIVVTGIENVNKMDMILCVCHTINFQNMGEKVNRTTDLVLELKRIFEELSIRYNLLPQEVRLTYTGSNALPMAMAQCTDRKH